MGLYMTERLIRRPEVEKMVGLKRSAIYKKMERGEFPKPVRIGERAVAWRLSEIIKWMDERL